RSISARSSLTASSLCVKSRHMVTHAREALTAVRRRLEAGHFDPTPCWTGRGGIGRPSETRIARVLGASRHQLLQQRLRLLQIARVKPFSEPAVDWREQFTRLLHLALVAPEACEAHGGTQFPGFGLLLARDSERASEFDLSLAL